MKFLSCLPSSISFLAIFLSLNNLLPVKPGFAENINPISTSLDALNLQLPFPNQDDLDREVCDRTIESSIDLIIQRSELKNGKWAILVQSLGGTNIYSLNPDSYMVPASNIKLLVTAAALQKLDPNGTIYSTSITDWIKVTNLKSNNAYANLLLRHLGGSQSVNQALSNLGVDTNGYRLKDGSGLSRNNLATPRTLVSTLRAMYHAKGNEVFLASLPVAGISGTLKNRMRHTTAEGAVRAKTGTLKGVKALSGYLNSPEYGVVVFSIITNQANDLASFAAVRAIDEIVLQLSNPKKCR